MTSTDAIPDETDHAEHPAGDEIRLAAVSYLNTTPLIEGVAKLPRVRLTLSAPAGLIDLLESGQAHMALASIIDAARSTHDAVVVPRAGIIGCDGPTLTVRVFSKKPLEQITELHTDADSHTSVALAQIILHDITGSTPTVTPFDTDTEAAEREQHPERPWPDALLMIGDKVVTQSPPAAVYPHQLDLGEAWNNATGLPFVYAAWMTLAENADDPAVHLGADLLERQRLHNATRLDWIIERWGRKRGWPMDIARRYLGELLDYDMTDRHREAIELFIRRAEELGLVEPGHAVTLA